jgi:hypothetical protein
MLIGFSIVCFIISMVLSYKVIPDERDESKLKTEKVFREIFFWAGAILGIVSYHFKDDGEKPQLSFANRYARF